jgi:hypothetical protein
MGVSIAPICQKMAEKGRIWGKESVFCALPVPESGNSDLKEKSRPFAPTGLSRLVTPVSGGTSGGCLLSVKEDVKGGKKEDKSHNTQGD